MERGTAGGTRFSASRTLVNHSPAVIFSNEANSFIRFLLAVMRVLGHKLLRGPFPSLKRTGKPESNHCYQRLERPSLEPPPLRSVFGLARLTFSARPSSSWPFSALMAISAACESDISTKAKPRERPVSRSVTRLARSTVPCVSKRERIDDSVASKLKLPTKIFVYGFLTVEGG